jgi:carboxylesterase
MPLLPGSEPFTADGGPVGAVLCHGFTGSPASMRPWGRHLADAGLSVRAPRLPGHGTRWQELNRTRWEDWYGELERAFDDLRSRCDAVFAMGLSMGGTLTLRLAEERGAELSGLVLVNPSLLTLRRDAKLVPYLRWLIPSVKGVAGDIRKPNSDEVAYSRTPVRAFFSLTQLWEATRADLAKVSQPLLVFTSRQDHVVEPENLRVLLRDVTSTDVTHVELSESYHVATLDYDAPTIFQRSVDFVRSHAPSTRV